MTEYTLNVTARPWLYGYESFDFINK
jgi:hypothetical protein